MKNLLLIVSMLFSVSTFASVSPYYSAEFEVVNVSPMCPRSVPNSAVCMGLGSIVKLVASVDCNDNLISFDSYEDASTSLVTELHVMNVIKRGKSLRRCFAPKLIQKTVTVLNMGPVSIVNDEVR